MMICLIASPFTQTQSAASKSWAQAKPTPPDDPLDEEGLAALVEKLKEALAEVIEDEDTQTSITDKWDARMEKLVGKTAKQVVDLFLADVKSIVKEAETVNQLKESFMAAATDSEPADEPEPSESPKPIESPEPGEQVTAPMQERRAGEAKSPLQDTQRFDSIKRTPMPSQTWTFNIKAGQLTFRYDGSGGIAEFKPNKTVGNSSISWIQVVRTGGKDRWYGSVADINTFSKNNANYVLRTDAVYGFRVDRTKGENAPFYDQTPLKNGETLNNYRLAFDISDRNTTSGATIRFSDNPDARGGLFRMKAADPKNNEYRMYFLLSPMNTQTGEIYGTVEWGVVANDMGVTGRVPSLITKDIPELKGRDLAFERWNTIFSKQYTPIFNFSKTVYLIPGKGRFWMK